MYALRQLDKVFRKHVGTTYVVVTGHLVTHAVERLVIPARGLMPWRQVHSSLHHGKLTDRQGFSYALIQYLAMC